jgi:carboxypeptidase C (cathepsin A)
LPTYGPPKTKHFAGLVNSTQTGENKLFYYFVEADVGSASDETPFLIWLNGGPGASSMMGLLVENLGPQKITVNSTLVDNEDRITKKYHLMVVDNPVGSGYSFTQTGAYVKSEEEMRTQFVHGVREFFKLHPEYRKNPLWVTGESYAGKYVPNIAYEMAVNATEIPLQGIVVGNGLYDELVQYTTIGKFAFGAGVIDERTLREEQAREALCLEKIKNQWSLAGDYCENQTVRWLYVGKDAVAGEMFYYDIGMPDAKEFDAITSHMSGYLNRADVKAALHVESATWVNADETGPVAEALRADFTKASAPVIAKLLESGKQVTLYNGVRDGSVCNHIGNLEALLNMEWSGQSEFANSSNIPWPSHANVLGHMRSAKNLRFATVLRTGHLVPTVVPDSYAILLDMAVKPVKTNSKVVYL